jgi:DNA polymerase I-like protein with 3'-5' exonuclease and polymerase domains/5'-3' exonuclease
MKRLLIDASHILKMVMFSAANGESAFAVGDVIVGHHLDAFERFLGSFKKTLEAVKMVPSQVILVKDGYRANAFRREIYPEYKVKKPGEEIPEEFFDQLSMLNVKVEELILTHGGIICWADDFEADDLIYALSQAMETVIWSGDKDLLAHGDVFFQGGWGEDKFFGIAKKHIVVYKALVGDNSDKIPGAKGFGDGTFLKMIEKYGDDCLDEFLEMLENETLHELAEYVSDFKPFGKIIEHSDLVYKSYQCAKPYHPGWNTIQWKARPISQDKEYLPEYSGVTKLVTKSMLTAEFMNTFRQQAKAVPLGYAFDIETWEDEESLAWGMANKAKTDKRGKLDARGSHLAGFSITVGNNGQFCYYFPVDHKDTDNLTLSDAECVLNLLDESKPMFVWNAEFELPITRLHCELRFDRGWLPNVHDAMIMKSYVNENTPLGLKDSSSTYLGYQQVTYAEVTTKDGVQYRMNELTGEEVVSYGCDDSICTLALASLFQVIMKFERTWKAFKLCEPSPAYLAAESFINGQKFDMEKLAELKAENDAQLEEVMIKLREKLVGYEWSEYDPAAEVERSYRMPGCEYQPIFEINAAAVKNVYQQLTKTKLSTRMSMIDKVVDLIREELPELASAFDSKSVDQVNAVAEELFMPMPSFSVTSDKDMEHLLYTAFRFEVRLRGKATEKMKEKGIRTGNPKVNEAAIRTAFAYDADEKQKEILDLVLEANKLSTNESLFLGPYAKMPNPKTGMVHGRAGQSLTTTRRAAPNGPNIAQVSKKTPIREIYAPFEDGWIWWSFDWSGQELRLTAERSQCPEMLKCYPKDGPAKDLHSIAALKIAELNKESYTYEEFLLMLSEKKMKNYRNAAKAVNFGGIYGQTEIGLANKLMITKEEALEIMKAADEAFPGVPIWKQNVRDRAIRDGFVSTLLGARKHLNLDGTWRDEHELRSAVNFEIQSPAAEQAKLAMAKIWDRKILEKYDAVFAFPVHDEINGSVRVYEGTVDFLKEIHAIMLEDYADMKVPIESSIEIGSNFGTLKELGTKFDEEKVREAIKEITG